MKRFLLTLFAVFALGCVKHQESCSNAPVFADREEQWVFAIVFDTGAPFLSTFSNAGAYEYCVQCCEQFARDRAGYTDSLLLSGIPAGRASPLWEGTMREMKERFPDETAFRDFVRSWPARTEADLYDGLASTLHYLTNIRGVREGKTRLAVLVLATMRQDPKNKEASRQKVVEALKRFKDRNAAPRDSHPRRP